jgi:hypothetical protein
MEGFDHSGFHAFAGEEIPDIDTAVQIGLYMVRGPSATTRLQADPGAEPKLRYLAKGAVPDHCNEAVSEGHREYDYLDWIARLTSHVPEPGTQLVHYYGAYSNAHRGITRWRQAFVDVPPEAKYGLTSQVDHAGFATRDPNWTHGPKIRKKGTWRGAKFPLSIAMVPKAGFDR